QDVLTYIFATLYTTPASAPFIADLAGTIQRTDNSTVWMACSRVLSVFFSLTYFLPYSQDCLNFVISLNRFTAIATPTKYRNKSYCADTRLFIFGILLWFCSLPLVTYQVYFAIIGHDADVDVITLGLPISIMTKSLTPPLHLILTNPNLRADF
ncbi:hypothetical protein PENTCL1PPCAC_4998, partial [Pristionchus entomophagus]